MERLQDKVAIVTGAASGIGKAIVQRFSSEGAHVIVADINAVAGEAVSASLASSRFVDVDVSDPASVKAMVADTLAYYGRLDILVNNAGISGQMASTVDGSLENWHQVMATNLSGVYFGMKYGIEAMLANEYGGAILNMASITGLVGYSNTAAYSAAKAGGIQLSRTAAIEYAPYRIRVNALCPTLVHTPLMEQILSAEDSSPEVVNQQLANFNPLPGKLTPQDVAAAALFLVSDEAKFITGVALPLDGGYTAR